MDIKVERLKVQFGDREILKNISLDFPKQKFTGIIGPNGSGKSTMLKCIYRVLEPDSGVIYLNGKPLSSTRSSKVRSCSRFWHNIIIIISILKCSTLYSWDAVLTKTLWKTITRKTTL